MTRELIEAAPIRRAMDDIADLESKQLEPVTREAVAAVRAIVVAAFEQAANPDGIDINEFARLRRLSPDGARKQARKLMATGAAEKRGGRFIIYVNQIPA